MRAVQRLNEAASILGVLDEAKVKQGRPTQRLFNRASRSDAASSGFRKVGIRADAQRIVQFASEFLYQLGEAPFLLYSSLVSLPSEHIIVRRHTAHGGSCWDALVAEFAAECPRTRLESVNSKWRL